VQIEADTPTLIIAGLIVGLWHSLRFRSHQWSRGVWNITAFASLDCCDPGLYGCGLFNGIFGAPLMIFISFLAGLIFGIGLIISGMANPAKVLGFLDLAGNWDPSLMLVMAGAIGVDSLLFSGLNPVIRRYWAV
jgi:uncharacterized membrane protein YedE/YeeE